MQKAHRITEDDKEIIRNMTIHGSSQYLIAEKIGCSQMAVSRHQKKMGLKASNKWHMGEIVEINPIPIEYKRDKIDSTMKVDDYLTLTDNVITFNGDKTGFLYNASLSSMTLRIETRYSDPFEVDLKDLANFSNELAALCERLEKTRE